MAKTSPTTANSKLIDGLHWVIDKVSYLTYIFVYWVCCVIMVIITAVVLYQVYGRYFLRQSPFWSEEIARYLMIWMGLLAAGSGIRTLSHVNVRFLLDKFPKILQKCINILWYLLIIWFCSIIIQQSPPMIARGARMLSPGLRTSMEWAYWVMPISAGYIILQSIYVVFHLILGIDPKEESEGRLT